MGKRKSMTWDHFDSYDNQGVEYGKCKYCPTTFRKNATRMTQHLLYKCEGIPEGARNEMMDHFPHITKRDYNYKMDYDWPDADAGNEQSNSDVGEDLSTDKDHQVM